MLRLEASIPRLVRLLVFKKYLLQNYLNISQKNSNKMNSRCFKTLSPNQNINFKINSQQIGNKLTQDENPKRKIILQKMKIN